MDLVEIEEAPKVSVLIVAYRRPELFRELLQLIRPDLGYRELRIVIDGPRSKADSKEIFWRKQTIQIAEEELRVNVRSSLKIYKDNVGYTRHIHRSLKNAFEIDSNWLLLEEDKRPIKGALDYLGAKLEENPAPFSLWAPGIHLNSNEGIGNTFFPRFGSETWNQQLLENSERIWTDKKLNSSLIHEFIIELFPGRGIAWNIFQKRMISYWTDYFNWGIHSSSRPDALAIYALLCLRSLFRIPYEPKVFDVSWRDFRGVNQEYEIFKPLKGHEPSWLNTSFGKICCECELHAINSRVPAKNMKALIESIKYRSKKYLHLSRVN